MEQAVEKIKIYCGSACKDPVMFWLLDPSDRENFRVYYNPENRPVDKMALEIDDFLGDPPRGYSWDLISVGNKRCEKIVEKVKSLWERK